MDSLRKRNTKKFKNGVKVKFLSEEELPIFRSFMEDTTETKEFQDRDDSFYYNRYRHFKDRVLVPLAYIKFDEYIEELQNERETLNKDVNKALKDIEKRPDNKKAFNKKENLEKQLDANQQKLDEAKNYKPNMVMNYQFQQVSSLLIHLKLFIMQVELLINIDILQAVMLFNGQ